MIVARRPVRQRGFTLIELMVALLVSSLLVGMILAIFARMSIAYRGQQQIAGVQQVLAAARANVELDAKQAGLGMPQGFYTALAPLQAMSAVQILDNAYTVGPDQIAFFYGDPSTQALVTAHVGLTSATIDQNPGFVVGDLIVMTTVGTSTTLTTPSGTLPVATYAACVLKIASITGSTPPIFTFSTAAPWGLVGQSQCSTVGPTDGTTMIYKFVAHAYRIDPTTARLPLGALQLSNNGGLLGASDTWIDLAYGFTDIQTALRVYDNDAIDQDNDGDALRDWYSGTVQSSFTKAPLAPISQLQVSVSLVARTDRTVEGVSSSATPNLTSATLPDYNSLGNRASIDLTTTVDPALTGARIFRYTTFQVDLRNLGIGR